MTEDERSTEERIDTQVDLIDGLLVEAVETARRHGYDAEDVQARLGRHCDALDHDGYTAYTPLVLGEGGDR